jgi:hypothetical protein
MDLAPASNEELEEQARDNAHGQEHESQRVETVIGN